MSLRRGLRWHRSLVLLAWPFALLAAQQPAADRSVATPARSAARAKVLQLSEYGGWNRIQGAAISANGQWATYSLQPNDGDATMYVKQLDGDKAFSFATGTAAAGGGGGGGGGFGGGGGGAQFSDDSRWIAYYVNPPGRAGGAGRGGRQGGQGAAPAAGAGRGPSRRLEVMGLPAGEKWPVPNAQSFSFAKGSRWLAIRLNRTATDTAVNSGDLIVRELATGSTRNFGNINQYAFNDRGQLLAYTVDAADNLGNGVYLVDLASGVTRTLSTGAADYDQLAWSDDGANLAVLRGTKARESKQKDNVLLAWLDAASAAPRAITYEPAKDPSFPKGMVLSEYAAPRWSKDGSRVLLGVKEQDAEPPRAENGEPQANVDVWHFKDPEPQSVQMVRLQQDRRATYPALLTVANAQLRVLGDSAMRTVAIGPSGKWGIGRLDLPYRGEVAWGGSRADFYRVNLETGERTLVASGLNRTMGTSPDNRWFLYLRDKHVFAYDLDGGRGTQIDASAGRSFVDAEDDHDYEKPIYGVAGWSKDGKSVLLNHRYDIWQLSLDGSAKPVNVTAGVGDAKEIEFRVVRLGAGGGGRGGRAGGGGAGAEDEGLDLTQPLTLSAYGQWTKKTGYWQVTAGQAPKELVWADRQIGGVTKAAAADRLLFTQQTFQEFPDYWVSDTKFTSPKKVTDANPQLAEYAWGSKVLIDYKNSKGKRLQGTLTLPAGYEPGKKYPMLVYFYEIMSNTHHQFAMPVYDDRPHISTYASDGYLVFQPDVVYEIGKPGSSAVDCVTSAVKKVIELGYADPKHIGLQGHSWGGYQSSYIVTQTDMFAAVVTGAPPTNLISFYDELYKSTGTVQQGIMEVGQVRMGENVTPWNSHELYEQQSPIFNVRNIKTPFLILQGTADGAVDWIEGLQYFNAARRNGKNVIFLSYPDEPHHLAKKENQKDFQVRMKQYFDHYLKGTPAPRWMTEGVPQVRKGGPIQ